MKKGIGLICLLAGFYGYGQTLSQKLDLAFKKLVSDSQLRHGIAAITVADAKTGNIIFEKNGELGLVPASTQKIITSISAFDLLGAGYRYQTVVSYDGAIRDSILTGNLHVLGSGDPTLGSDRWTYTGEKEVLRKIVAEVKKAGIKKIQGEILCGNDAFSAQVIPGGWLWEDIGSYYGAGAYSVNWRENCYDIEFTSEKELGKKVTLKGAVSGRYFAQFVNEVITDKKGSGDNAYIYHALDQSTRPVLKGTIPVDQKSFIISGAYPNPGKIFSDYLHGFLQANGVDVSFQDSGWYSRALRPEAPVEQIKKANVIGSLTSPSLDSMNYYFLRNSINLYGEAFVKSICLSKTGTASTDKGVELIKDFWLQKGIEKTVLNIYDGSGLSPRNRVTTNALLAALKYALKRPWFASFYQALPEYNGMKLKSGSMGGVRGYAGYYTAKNGNEYIIAVIVNNYSGNAATITKKIFTVLDVLK